jgi:hypothetical protein
MIRHSAQSPSRRPFAAAIIKRVEMVFLTGSPAQTAESFF